MNFKQVMCFSFIFLITVNANAGLIDLSSWSEEGPGGGLWTVAGDNNSVFQSVNSLTPTFFISDNPFINSTFTGTIAVETTSDNDFIGFVFGYKSPFSGNGDATTDFEFLLFDWKQSNQGSAISGFHLSHVTGDFSDNNISHNTQGSANPFWSHVNNVDSNSSFTVLDSLTGGGLGWADNTSYDFELTFQTDLIEIAIDGGAFDMQTIFSVAGSFEPGSFGFYNLSQKNVRYSGITETAAPVSEPSIILLFSLGFFGVAVKRFYKAD